MKPIIDFFVGLVDVIVSLVDFVIQTISDIAYMVSVLGQMLANIPAYFGWLPSVIASSVVVLFTFAMIFKILGREG